MWSKATSQEDFCGRLAWFIAFLQLGMGPLGARSGFPGWFGLILVLGVLWVVTLEIIRLGEFE